MKKQTFWITGFVKKNGTIEYDIESLSFYRKDAKAKCVKALGGHYTWKQLYQWRRRTFKVTLDIV